MNGYSIVTNTDMQVPSPAGGYEPGRRIIFVTGDNHRGEIRIPLRLFTPEYVDGKIKEQITMIDAVNALGS